VFSVYVAMVAGAHVWYAGSHVRNIRRERLARVLSHALGATV
jgi:hypothetical protein